MMPIKFIVVDIKLPFILDMSFLKFDLGWVSHCEMQLTMKIIPLVLTQVVANRTSSKALSYQPSLGLM